MDIREEDKKCLSGATKMINSIKLSIDDGLIILNSEGKEEKKISEYLITTAKINDLKNVIEIVLPNIIRPIITIPPLLINAVKCSKGLVHVVNRLPEEEYTFNQPLQNICVENKCKYIYIYDGKVRYLKEGIDADYKIVHQKMLAIGELLRNSKEIRVSSDIGTNLRFSIYTNDVRPRSPIFEEGNYWNQAPEGEALSVPIEETFNGTFAIDGAVTGLGIPKTPIFWVFKNGVVTDVKSDDKQFLSDLLEMIQKSDDRVESLLGMWIAEFSVGGNDWAIFDESISNSEKVSGGVHFAMGQTALGIGVERGEKYHFDNIVSSPSITIEKTTGEQVNLTKDGKLLI